MSKNSKIGTDIAGPQKPDKANVVSGEMEIFDNNSMFSDDDNSAFEFNKNDWIDFGHLPTTTNTSNKENKIQKEDSSKLSAFLEREQAAKKKSGTVEDQKSAGSSSWMSRLFQFHITTPPPSKPESKPQHQGQTGPAGGQERSPSSGSIPLLAPPPENTAYRQHLYSGANQSNDTTSNLTNEEWSQLRRRRDQSLRRTLRRSSASSASSDQQLGFLLSELPTAEELRATRDSQILLRASEGQVVEESENNSLTSEALDDDNPVAPSSPPRRPWNRRSGRLVRWLSPPSMSSARRTVRRIIHSPINTTLTPQNNAAPRPTLHDPRPESLFTLNDATMPEIEENSFGGGIGWSPRYASDDYRSDNDSRSSSSSDEGSYWSTGTHRLTLYDSSSSIDGDDADGTQHTSETTRRSSRDSPPVLTIPQLFQQVLVDYNGEEDHSSDSDEDTSQDWAEYEEYLRVNQNMFVEYVGGEESSSTAATPTNSTSSSDVDLVDSYYYEQQESD